MARGQNFTPEEDAIILERRSKKLSYEIIARSLPHRTPVSIKLRYRRLVNGGRVACPSL